VKNANKYWTEAAASNEFSIATTTLRHAWVRGDIETVTMACGLTLLYGPSLRKYAKRHRPRNKISRVIRAAAQPCHVKDYSRSTRLINAGRDGFVWKNYTLGAGHKGRRQEIPDHLRSMQSESRYAIALAFSLKSWLKKVEKKQKKRLRSIK
jgi:hypothetical protein